MRVSFAGIRYQNPFVPAKVAIHVDTHKDHYPASKPEGFIGHKLHWMGHSGTQNQTAYAAKHLEIKRMVNMTECCRWRNRFHFVTLRQTPNVFKLITEQPSKRSTIPLKHS